MGNIETEWNLTKAKQKLTYSAVSFLSGCLMRIPYSFEVEGVKNVPRKGPVVIAAKHVNFFDPYFYTAPLLDVFPFYPSFPMRSVGKFDRALGLLGALKLYRPRDVGRAGSLIQQARENNSDTLALLDMNLAARGHNIIFPEATRKPGVMGEFYDKLFIEAMKAQEKYGREVLVVPGGINYEKNGYRTTVRVGFGEPLRFQGSIERLVADCKEDVRKLSGL